MPEASLERSAAAKRRLTGELLLSGVGLEQQGCAASIAGCFVKNLTVDLHGLVTDVDKAVEALSGSSNGSGDDVLSFELDNFNLQHFYVFFSFLK